ncbi:MAG TPA: glycine cleavage T C-terminal barrel domain-containing protein [Gemmatimonadales bacterium]|nr:glycine cleavage T C-terminal barrel domain-containing protein [Gemmatimonadales bacterium]
MGYPIGTTFLPAGSTKAGTRFEVDIRGTRVAAEVVARPFYGQGSVRK